MWIPKDETEINNAVANNALEESVTFDAKREIPAKNIETAKDVSALANTSGGVLIYGIDEDENGFPNVLNPIDLEGQRERIEAIIRTSIDEVPVFKITAIQTQADRSKGYLIVIVPPSERAPHMVIVKGERRFYGRGETGNYVLSQDEVARLYERRKLSIESISLLLEETIQNSPLKDHNGFAHLYIVARPVLQDSNILSNAAKKMSNAMNGKFTHQAMLSTHIEKVGTNKVFKRDYAPDFRSPSNWTRRPEGFFGKMEYPSSNSEIPNADTLFIQVNFDGSADLFCGRAAETTNRNEQLVKLFFSSIVAGNTIRFLSLLGGVYDDASYFGMVDIGVGLSGLERCVAYGVRWGFSSDIHYYDDSNYRKTTRVSALLLRENSKQVASDLLMPLIDAISQGRDNPFQ